MEIVRFRAFGRAGRRRWSPESSSAAALDRRWPISAFPGSKRTRSGSGSVFSARVIHTWPQRGDAGLGKGSSTARAARQPRSPPERGAWAPRVRQGLRNLAQREPGGLGVLTQGLERAEMRRRMAGVEVRWRRWGGFAEKGAAGPFRAPGLHGSSIGGPAWELRWSQRLGGRRR